MKKENYVLLVGDKKNYVTTSKNDFHAKEGMIEKKKLENADYGDVIETNTGKQFCVVKPSLNDLKKYVFRRKAQVIMNKDAATIIEKSAIDKDSKVAEAGSGSGFLTASLANAAGNVYSYDNREEHQEVAEENMFVAGFENVEFEVRDVKEKGFTQEDLDLVVLDMKHPEEAVENAYNALGNGGYLIVYSPVLEQASDAVEKAKEFDVQLENVVENIQRNWNLSPKKPLRDEVGHTAFIAIMRKLG